MLSIASCYHSIRSSRIRQFNNLCANIASSVCSRVLERNITIYWHSENHLIEYDLEHFLSNFLCSLMKKCTQCHSLSVKCIRHICRYHRKSFLTSIDIVSQLKAMRLKTLSSFSPQKTVKLFSKIELK